MSKTAIPGRTRKTDANVSWISVCAISNPTYRNYRKGNIGI